MVNTYDPGALLSRMRNMPSRAAWVRAGMREDGEANGCDSRSKVLEGALAHACVIIERGEKQRVCGGGGVTNNMQSTAGIPRGLIHADMRRGTHTILCTNGHSLTHAGIHTHVHTLTHTKRTRAYTRIQMYTLRHNTQINNGHAYKYRHAHTTSCASHPPSTLPWLKRSRSAAVRDMFP